MNEDIQEIKIVCFRLDQELYAADIMRVKEIIKPRQVAGLPEAPTFIDGVINLRGAIIPVLNLRKKFKLPPADDDGMARFLIVALDGRIFALAVDEVTEVVTVPVKDLRPPPHFEHGVSEEYIVAVCLFRESLVLLLNLDKLLHFHELDVLQQLECSEEMPC